MKILIVDDQSAVLRGLEKGIGWETLGFSQVHTANSAAEAKLILINYDIDILLTDIEMPEENGLELFRWTRSRFPNLVGVFLTSHADFGYVKEAMALGGFDYILQPARFSEVERVLFSAAEKARSNVHIEKLKKNRKAFIQQRDRIFASMAAKEKESVERDYQEMAAHLRRLLEIDYVQCGFRMTALRVVQFSGRNQWKRPLLQLAFRNVLEELLSPEKGRVIFAGENLQEYLLLVTTEAGTLTDSRWHQALEELYQFICNHMDFSVALYPMEEELTEVSLQDLRKLRLRLMELAEKAPGIYGGTVVQETDSDAMAERIHEAMTYIRENLGYNISRAEMAERVHLNEEYFSKLFHKYAGCTFKEYVMEQRLRQAQRLLKHSKLSVSLIASRVGYDNFSYFSRAFKKATGKTPQEYRKEYTDGKQKQST